MRKLMLMAGVGCACACACAALGAPKTLTERLADPKPFLIAHRGYQPDAPENSIPSFTRAGELGYPAIETDVRLTKDGKLICSHDASLKRMFGVDLVVEKTDFAELRKQVMNKGNKVGTYPADKLHPPTFDEYLDLCAKYDCVPFIETKGPVTVVKPVLDVLEKRGLLDVAVLSAVPIEHIREARKLNKRVFVHHIFSKPELLDEIAAMGNSGVSWDYPEPSMAPKELLERTHAKGVKYCLRGADTPEIFAQQKALGCDYFPANVTKPDSMAFPDEQWARMEPKEAGFVDLAAIEEIGKLMEKAKANGVLIRNGRLIVEWANGGPTDQQFEAQSITKSFTSLMLGLALDDKLVPSLDTKVKEVFPAFEGGSHTREITFRHLATMTSGIKPTRYQLHFPKETAPGEWLNYHADQPAHLTRALTYSYERPLYDVLKERILDPIGAKASWPYDKAPWSPVETRTHGAVPVNCGFAFFHINAGDLARVGHLYLNKGIWKGRQLISENFLAECWTPIPQKDLRQAHQTDRYGLYWWQLTPGVWYMSGTWGQFCLVWPEQGIVMTKLNKSSSASVGVRPFFGLLHRAVTGKDFGDNPKPAL